MNKNILIGGIAVVFIVGAVFLAVKNTPTPVAENTGSTSQDTQLAGTPEVNDTPASPNNNDGTQANVGAQVGVTVGVSNVTVTYTDTGFTPSTITVKQGTKVTFVNNSSKNMWVGVDEHPTHTQYAGTSRQEHCPDTAGTAFDQCAVGKTYTFTFNKVGTWEYHNHVGSGTGKIVVTQ